MPKRLFAALRKLYDRLWQTHDAQIISGITLALALLFMMLFTGPCYKASKPKLEPTPVLTLVPTEVPTPAPRKKQPPASMPMVLPTQVSPLPAHTHEPTVRTVPPADTPTRVPTVPPEPTATATAGAELPVAPGGGLRTLVFASARSDGRHYQLYSMDSNGQNLQRLTSTRGFDRDPNFSWDGEQIVYSSNQAGGDFQVFILTLKTHESRQLTFDKGSKSHPIWTPDSRRVVFTHHVGNETHLYVMNVDGTNRQRLNIPRAFNHAYSVSPDGDRVAFAFANEKEGGISIYRLGSREIVPLVSSNDLVSYGDPIFSPQGHKMIFTADHMLHHIKQIYIYDLAWNKYDRLIRDNTHRDDPVFSPDATLIAFTARWKNAWNIYIMNADGTEARNLTQSVYDNVQPTWR